MQTISISCCVCCDTGKKNPLTIICSCLLANVELLYIGLVRVFWFAVAELVPCGGDNPTVHYTGANFVVRFSSGTPVCPQALLGQPLHLTHL